MIGLEPLRLLLTAAFGGASVFHLFHCLRPAAAHPNPAADHRFSELLHLFMGVAMIGMIWPWGRIVPAPFWVTVFILSTGWFAARALWSAEQRLVLSFFATTMAAMVWMSASMPTRASMDDHADMNGMAGISTQGGAGSLHYTAWISVALGCYLVVAAIWWVCRGLRIGGLANAGAEPRPLSWSALCHGLMSAAMGLTLLTMA